MHKNLAGNGDLSETSTLAATSTSRNFAGDLVRYLHRPIERRLFNYFKAFLALKLYLGPLLDLGPDGTLPTLASIYQRGSSGSSLILLLACAITIASPINYKFGLWIFLVRKFSFIAGTMPMTANHAGLEFLLLLILLIFPATPVQATAKRVAGQPGPGMVDGRACRLILFAIVSVYFWSGIQKLFHGYYLNGEFFTFFLFATKGEASGGFLRATILFLVDLMGLAPLPQLSAPNWLRASHFEYPAWVIHLLVAQSWTVIAAEVGLPVLLLFERTRAAASILFIPLAMAIALISGETDFAMTNLACLLLPRTGRGSGLIAATLEPLASLVYPVSRSRTLG